MKATLKGLVFDLIPIEIVKAGDPCTKLLSPLDTRDVEGRGFYVSQSQVKAVWVEKDSLGTLRNDRASSNTINDVKQGHSNAMPLPREV